MKKLLLSASALFALAAGSADAADMARPVYKAPLVCPTCDWNGFYVGFNVGESKGWSDTNENWTWNSLFPAGTTGFVGGGFPAVPVVGPFSTSQGSAYRHASMGFIGG